MNTQKQLYLASVRSASTYPTFRGVIGFFTGLSYVLAGLIVLAALMAAANARQISSAGGPIILLGGAILAAIVILLARFLKEAALILADIGDALVDSNSRVSST